MEKKVGPIQDWRNTRESWDEYYMHLAIATAMRSSCWVNHVGALIVQDKRVIASGYNGRAADDPTNCLDEGCIKEARGVKELNQATCAGCHAETNALLQPTAVPKQGAVIYTTISPCYSCAKQISSARLSEVVYMYKYIKEFEQTKEQLHRVGIVLRQFIPTQEKLRGGIEALFAEYAEKYQK